MDTATVATIVGAVGTGAGAVVGALGGWWGRRRAEARADRLEAREIHRAEKDAETAAISERDQLIRTITDTLVEPLRQEVATLRSRLEKAEESIATLEDRNDRLVAFTYKLIGIIRKVGAIDEISPADVPPGIHI
jgi:uncharacterized protein HemX